MLRGSSPSPGASDVGSKANNIYVKREGIPEKVFYKENGSARFTNIKGSSIR
jgi:hypothetical protein